MKYSFQILSSCWEKFPDNSLKQIVARPITCRRCFHCSNRIVLYSFLRRRIMRIFRESSQTKLCVPVAACQIFSVVSGLHITSDGRFPITNPSEDQRRRNPKRSCSCGHLLTVHSFASVPLLTNWGG